MEGNSCINISWTVNQNIREAIRWHDESNVNAEWDSLEINLKVDYLVNLSTMISGYLETRKRLLLQEVYRLLHEDLKK